MVRPVVLDNTVLVNFALAKRPDLALQTWPEAICTTPEVKEEYRQGVSSGVLPESAWSKLPVVELTAEEAGLAERLSAQLGAGERSCLAVALHREGLFASDDADARGEARGRDIPVTGTIGILARAVRKHFVSLKEANALLTRMIDAGYHAPVRRLDDLL